ncbi:hypothetical protein DL96DRAFT_458761 [Flagelloscypha sp. PMI_526]|nr:hypothetical protein DL96DRAFT_458761 [Flagelloscypha sp. PMI_526]
MSTPPQSAIPTDLLLLAARFVVRDQWLTTRVPTTWHVDQLKAWLLNKCLHIPLPPDFDRRVEHSPQSARPTSPITFAPNPRNRPISPIRFAARQTHSSTPYSSNEELSDSDSQDPIDNPEVSLVGGYEEDDEESDEDIQISPRPPSEKKKRRLSQQVTRPIFASGSSKSSAIRQRYMLVRFSTGQILEGDFAISWYSLSPFELLEIHPVDVLIRLPRYSISDYCQPYFRARVRLLRVLEGKLHFHDQNIVEEYGPEVKRAGARQERVLEKLPKTRFEWRERWIIIQGNSLHICKTEVNIPLLFLLSSLCSTAVARLLHHTRLFS